MEAIKRGRPPKGEEFGCPTRKVNLPVHLIERLREKAKQWLAEEREQTAQQTNEEKMNEPIT